MTTMEPLANSGNIASFPKSRQYSRARALKALNLPNTFPRIDEAELRAMYSLRNAITIVERTAKTLQSHLNIERQRGYKQAAKMIPSFPSYCPARHDALAVAVLQEEALLAKLIAEDLAGTSEIALQMKGISDDLRAIMDGAGNG